jgi:GNAT superfamily N-acetyltransferase
MVHVMPDGAAYLLRPIRPDDKPRLQTGLRRLSPESAYRRFLAPKPRLSSGELRYLTEVDGHDHAALVAVPAWLPQPDAPVVAVGRWVRLADDPDRAEVAVVVGDPLQGKGLGRAIGLALADLARAEGIRAFWATMLADNAPALRLLTAIAGPLESRVGGGVRDVLGELGPARARDDRAGAAARVLAA